MYVVVLFSLCLVGYFFFSFLVSVGRTLYKKKHRLPCHLHSVGTGHEQFIDFLIGWREIHGISDTPFETVSSTSAEGCVCHSIQLRQQIFICILYVECVKDEAGKWNSIE